MRPIDTGFVVRCLFSTISKLLPKCLTSDDKSHPTEYRLTLIRTQIDNKEGVFYKSPVSQMTACFVDMVKRKTSVMFRNRSKAKGDKKEANLAPCADYSEEFLVVSQVFQRRSDSCLEGCKFEQAVLDLGDGELDDEYSNKNNRAPIHHGLAKTRAPVRHGFAKQRGSSWTGTSLGRDQIDQLLALEAPFDSNEDEGKGLGNDLLEVWWSDDTEEFLVDREASRCTNDSRFERRKMGRN